MATITITKTQLCPKEHGRMKIYIHIFKSNKNSKKKNVVEISSNVSVIIAMKME